MKLEIDTKNKTLRVLESIPIGELVNEVSELLGATWESYTLLYPTNHYYNNAPLTLNVPPVISPPYTILC